MGIVIHIKFSDPAIKVSGIIMSLDCTAYHVVKTRVRSHITQARSVIFGTFLINPCSQDIWLWIAVLLPSENTFKLGPH